MATMNLEARKMALVEGVFAFTQQTVELKTAFQRHNARIGRIRDRIRRLSDTHQKFVHRSILRLGIPGPPKPVVQAFAKQYKICQLETQRVDKKYETLVNRMTKIQEELETFKAELRKILEEENLSVKTGGEGKTDQNAKTLNNQS